MILVVTIVAVPNAFGQQVPGVRDGQEEAHRARYQEKLQQILNDKAGYSAAIVRRWEESARANGRWDENYTTDLQDALTKLQPENLLAAGEASSYDAMMTVLATGRQSRTLTNPRFQTRLRDALGSVADDLTYTPVTPCRIADTRFAVGGAIAANTTHTFDIDGSNFSAQGGFNGSCGIPLGVARAVAMTITVTQPVAGGYFSAWQVGTPQPLTSVLNYEANQTIANTTIVPVIPGAGADFSLYSLATAHAVIDVVGYFAAPVATALDCTTVSSAVTAVAVNVWTPVDASCPAGRTATGGGYNTSEGTLGYPGVWLTTLPNGNGWRTWVDNQTNGNRNIQTFATCCRVPGR